MPRRSTGTDFWEEFWEQWGLPVEVDLTRNPQRLQSELVDRLCESAPQGRVLEAGCGLSQWLAYAQKHGMRGVGLEFSERVAQRGRQNLLAQDVVPRVVRGDVRLSVFKPESFDAIMSFGLLEHFEDATPVLSHFYTWLRPGGTVLSTVPNLTGLQGMLLRNFNRINYDEHVVHSRESLVGAHRRAGFQVDDAVWAFGFAVPAVGPRPIRAGLRLANRAGWGLSRVSDRKLDGRFLSAAVAVFAHKPE